MAKSSLRTERETYATEFVKADYDRAYFHSDPLIDSLFTSLTALGATVWALQRRQTITEKLLEQNGSVTAEMIENYLPTKAEAKQMQADRDAFVAELYGPFRESGDIAYGSTMHPPAAPSE